jgi:hypothetical protein
MISHQDLKGESDGQRNYNRKHRKELGMKRLTERNEQGEPFFLIVSEKILVSGWGCQTSAMIANLICKLARGWRGMRTLD